MFNQFISKSLSPQVNLKSAEQICCFYRKTTFTEIKCIAHFHTFTFSLSHFHFYTFALSHFHTFTLSHCKANLVFLSKENIYTNQVYCLWNKFPIWFYFSPSSFISLTTQIQFSKISLLSRLYLYENFRSTSEFLKRGRNCSWQEVIGSKQH